MQGSSEERAPSGKLSLDASRQQPIPRGSQSGKTRGCIACEHDRFEFIYVWKVRRRDGWLVVAKMLALSLGWPAAAGAVILREVDQNQDEGLSTL